MKTSGYFELQLLQFVESNFKPSSPHLLNNPPKPSNSSPTRPSSACPWLTSVTYYQPLSLFCLNPLHTNQPSSACWWPIFAYFRPLVDRQVVAACVPTDTDLGPANSDRPGLIRRRPPRPTPTLSSRRRRRRRLQVPRTATDSLLLFYCVPLVVQVTRGRAV